jgi:hypothetical protein
MAKRSTQTRIKGASSADRQNIAAARKSAARTTDSDLGDAVTVVKEQHTRLAEPGETPATQEKSFEKKIRFGADQETHTRLATPDDPEAKQQMKELNAARKARGEPVEVVQRGENTAEAQPTPKEARAAAEKQFQKADEAGKAEIIAERQLRNAALGSGF